jgi:glycerophosphoryl diester phosphodiesterase
LEELRTYHFPDGQTIPTFEELIELTSGKIRLLAELKADGLEQDVIAMIREHDLGESAIIQSFKGRHILNCHAIEPTFHYAMCIGPAGFRGPFARIAGKLAYNRLVKPYPVEAVNIDGPRVTEEFVHECLQHGIKIILGAMSTEKYLGKIASWQVWMINANDPGRIREVLEGATSTANPD